MRKQYLLLGALCLMSASASAFSGISSKFDGTYKGSGELVAKSGPSCMPVTFDQVTIKAGHLSSSGNLQVAGFITEEGYVDATMKPLDGTKVNMDGRLTADGISAGAMDPARGCSWIVKLQKAD